MNRDRTFKSGQWTHVARCHVMRVLRGGTIRAISFPVVAVWPHARMLEAMHQGSHMTAHGFELCKGRSSAESRHQPAADRGAGVVLHPWEARGFSSRLESTT
jgi:hypothetical protein